jgi:hypothetical protein
MSIEAMKRALEALERLNNIDGMYSWVDTEQALRQAIEQAEKQEPDLPPVFIGVDVTLKGTQVNAFYRRPNDVAEMFYSEFHPLAKPEQEPVAWRNAAIRLGEDLYSVGPNGYYEMTAKQWLDWALSVVNTAPPRKEWVGLTEDDIVDLYCQVGDETEWAIGELKDAMPFANLVEAKLKEKNNG